MSLSQTLLNNKKYLVIALGAILLGSGWSITTNLLNKPIPTKEIPLVRTITIHDTTATSSNSYPGEIRGRYESALAFQVAGRVTNRYVKLGDYVRKGQTLLTIDAQDIQQAVNTATAAVNAATANSKLANDNANRFRTLYQEGAVSASTYEQYNTQAAAATATLKQARAQLTAASNQLSYTRLTAPQDGVIASLTGEVGMVVAAGTPMVSVVQGNAREIQFFVPENRVSSLRPNMPATVTFWALDNTEITGHIYEISPIADPVTRTYKVRVALNNMPATAKLGMTAKVVLTNDSTEELLLPRTAIYQSGDTPQVWVVKDNQVHLTTIQTNGYKNNMVVVTAGLNKKDVVVTAGINKLVNNMEVRVEGGGQP